MNTAHIIYKIKDNTTSLTYTGVSRLGDYALKGDNPDHIMKDLVFKNVDKCELIVGDKLYLHVELPSNFKRITGVKPRDDAHDFLIDVAKNLTLPRYCINQTSYSLIGFSIGCSSKLSLPVFA